ncbi:MAG: hypothetical protein SH859_01660 [Hyphomicrobium aestuarii]|nr:hypothetical protein [Hyphomicrobium aestuarii]
MTSPDPAGTARPGLSRMRRINAAHVSTVLAVAAIALVIAGPAVTLPSHAIADDSWNPFRFPGDEPRPRRRPAPAALPDQPPQTSTAPSDPDPYSGPNNSGSYGAPAGSLSDSQPGGPAGGASPYAPATLNESARGVEREELAPVLAGDGSGLPFELWRGLDVAAVEAHLAKLDIPPRSPTLHGLWRRLITSGAAAPGSASGAAAPGSTSGAAVPGSTSGAAVPGSTSGAAAPGSASGAAAPGSASGAAAPGASGNGNARFDGLRADALYRSGLVTEATTLAERAVASTDDPASVILAAKIGVAGGAAGSHCDRLKSIIPRKADLPRPLQRDLLILSGACAAITGNPGGAGLAAELLREEISRDPKLDDPAALAALDAAATQTKAPARGKPVTLLQYRLHQIGGGMDSADIARGEPALVATVALDGAVDPATRLLAAETAARFNALSPRELSDVYRAAGAAVPTDQLLQGPGTRPPTQGADARAATTVATGASASAGARATAPLPADASRRASLYKAAEAERTPLRKVRLLRALLDDAKRAGLYWQTLELLGPLIIAIQPVPEIGWFAETGIEIALVSGQSDRGRQWAALGGSVPGDGGLRHWLPLIDLVDPALGSERGRSLASIEDLAGRGRLSADLLHRLATVLDAHDINVPIPLWEATSKAPQPAGGHLPETGVLSELQDAAKKKEFGRTVLLVMRTLGPNGAEGANIIALGDGIRALRRAGLEDDARRLGLEALFAQWPRGAIN